MSREAPMLRRNLLVRVLGPLALLFLAGGVSGFFVASHLANEVYNGQLLENAFELSFHLVQKDGRVRLDLSAAVQRLLLADPDDEMFYRISTDTGQFVGGDARLPLPRHFGPSTPIPSFYPATVDGRTVRIALIRADVDFSTFLLQMGETTVKRTALVRRILESIVLPQLVLVIVAVLLVWVGIARGLSPLQRLRKAVEQRSHLDLSPISQDHIPGEVRPLLHAINGLMARLGQVLSLQTRFIADAAHQLRTPVAGLKTNIELTLREAEPAAMQESLRRTLLSIDRLSRLVSQLLSLARNEPAAAIREVRFGPVDLARLIFTLTMDWVPEAYGKGIDLGFEGPDHGVMIDGDAARLTELANNLLDNAVRYTGTDGRVTARVSSAPQPAFSVSDDGPRIPSAERERIFERFHRILGTPTDGSGLGLAIVREVATLHGAQVDLADDADGIGNRFTVTFPVAFSGNGSQPPAALGSAGGRAGAVSML